MPPPYPALLIVPGYISEPTLPKSWARMGYAAVGVAPRGKLRSNRHFNPGYPGLLTSNIVDRHTYAYRGFYIDAARAVDFVLSRPEVDHTRIGVHGSSQGGALTIATAALRADAITVGAAGAPYLCGYMDCVALTHSWPYEEINDYLRQLPGARCCCARDAELLRWDQLRAAASAARCCSTSAWVTMSARRKRATRCYDALSCPKELHAYPRCAHDAGIYWEMPKVRRFSRSTCTLPPLAGAPTRRRAKYVQYVAARVGQASAVFERQDQRRTNFSRRQSSTPTGLRWTRSWRATGSAGAGTAAAALTDFATRLCTASDQHRPVPHLRLL